MDKFKVSKFDRDGIKAILPVNQSNATLESILTLLSAGPVRCNWIIVEDNYLDEDYLAEYAAYYCTVFLEVPSRCRRIHFIAGELEPNLAELRLLSDDDYLGFMVWRPTLRQEVGRTILSARLLQHEHGKSEGHRRFLHCVADYSAHLRDAEFSIQGTPFIQQDMQVGACAHAALWMAARYMSSRFGDRNFTIAQINLLAKRTNTVGRLYPADYGLRTMQILAALDGMGLAFHIDSLDGMEETGGGYAFPAGVSRTRVRHTEPDTASERHRVIPARGRRLADIAYRYIESGLPVLLATEVHLVVAIGHTLKEDEIPGNEAGLMIERIPSFLIHNDSVGPYQEMPLWEHPKADPENLGRGLVFADVKEVISIMPHEVSLRGEAAEIIALSMVESLPACFELADQPLDAITEHMRAHPEVSHVWGDLDPAKPMPGIEAKVEVAPSPTPGSKPLGPRLLSRTFLLRSYEWLRYIRYLHQKMGYPQKITEHLMGIDYPRYVWVTEITTQRALAEPPATDDGTRTCLGFVVLDSTMNSDANAAIVAHVGDVMVQFRDTVRRPAGQTKGEGEKAASYVIFAPGSTPIPFKSMSWESRRPARHGSRHVFPSSGN